MQVENWTQDFANFNQIQNSYGIKPAPGTLSKRARTRLLREAQQAMDGFGIDFSQYQDPTVSFMDMLIAQVTWVHTNSGQTLELTGIWFDEQSGEILQCGTNAGSLIR